MFLKDTPDYPEKFIGLLILKLKLTIILNIKINMLSRGKKVR